MVFIDSMQFMSSNFDKLVRHLIDNDFKHLTDEFEFKTSELLIQKGVCVHGQF